MRLSFVGRTVRMLWLGFEERALASLDEFASGVHGPAFEERALTEVARWHATFGRETEALDAIDRVVEIGREQELDATSRLLAVDLLTRRGRYQDALALLDAPPEQASPSADDILRRANILLKSGAHVSDVLATVNEIFERRGIAPIRRGDPELPLNLSNVRAATHAGSAASKQRVSIVMPAYNAAKVIGYALQGLIEQTWANIEVIVVDDDSSDDTAEVAATFADPRITVVRNEGKGAYSARNCGLAHATGEFVTVHDADDWSHPEKIERQVHHLIANDSVAGSQTSCVRTSFDLEFVEPSLRPRPKMIVVNTSSFMAHRRVFDVLGQWDDPVASADNELIERCRRFYGPSSVIELHPDVPLSFCLRASTSLTSSITGTGILSLQHCAGARRIYRDSYVRWHARPDFVDSLPVSAQSRPAPIHRPRLLDAGEPAQCRVDVVVLGDLTLDEAAASVMLGIERWTASGRSVGLIHVPLYQAEFDRYREMADQPLGPLCPHIINAVDGRTIRFVSAGESVDTDLLVIANGDVLNDKVVALPGLTPKEVAVVVHRAPPDDKPDLPRTLDSAITHSWIRRLREIAGHEATWYPATDAVRRELQTARLPFVIAPEAWPTALNDDTMGLHVCERRGGS